MSLTEVYTETREGRTASTGSLSLHIRPPRAPQEVDDGRKSFDKGGDIELAQLGNVQDECVPQSREPGTAKTSPSPVPESTHPTAEERWKARMQFAACCLPLFVMGWNDGATGPLLPRIQENYHVCALCMTHCITQKQADDGVGWLRRCLFGVHIQLLGESIVLPVVVRFKQWRCYQGIRCRRYGQPPPN